MAEEWVSNIMDMISEIEFEDAEDRKKFYTLLSERVAINSK